ncbi:Uma2 family endonuclease [Nocardia colli]|uniref:Uma2 family endonuclease n=1 Tax=Nocardia colli TaxID=2545717 RepID=A0A5N0ELF8_9NOCA|nr:Uma2 family endonuclease [Nocardia colli]KAA8890082.1 Uma2 family endonuclease [Nocardia colli]
MGVQAPQMSTGEFEELAGAADRIAEGLRLEFIEGKLSAKPLPDGNHGCIIAWLIRLCLRHRPELWLSASQGLVVGDDRTGRVRPDGVLADAEAFVGQGEWANADSVLMVVEVTSPEEDNDRTHRTGKVRIYATTGISVYLFIDRESREVTVYSGLRAGHYQQVATTSFGAEVALPSPVELALDTGSLEQWVR